MELTVNNHIHALPLSNELKFEKNGKLKVIKVEPLSMKLLEYLLSHRGEVCTNQALIDSIWDGNLEVGRPALRKNIYKLRAVLSRLGEEEIIQTIPKKGYRLGRLPLKSRKPFFRRVKFYYVLVIMFFLLIVLKIIFPGIIHRLLH